MQTIWKYVFWKDILHPQPRIKRLETLRQNMRGEAQYLAGRHSRTREFFRVVRICIEFIRGMRALHRIGPAITVFGSARFKENHRYYDLARKVGATLAREGYTVMTGGGPGIMEAANRGAKDLGGPTVGCNILLPQEQAPNGFLDRVVTFYYFFVRKVMLVKYSYGFIILPGGFGTLDEMMEAVTLIQTGKLYDFPVILMGTDFWKGYYEWIKNTLITNGTISEEDLSFLHLTDDPEEAIRIIHNTIQGLGLKLVPIHPSSD